jgi:hypothetical protein
VRWEELQVEFEGCKVLENSRFLKQMEIVNSFKLIKHFIENLLVALLPIITYHHKNDLKCKVVVDRDRNMTTRKLSLFRSYL